MFILKMHSKSINVALIIVTGRKDYVFF